VTREILSGGARFSAVDVFRAEHRLAELRRRADTTWAEVDALCVPSVPTRYTLAELEADPVERNARLGRYTHSANLLDLAAVAVPSALRADGFPAGITLLAPAGTDEQLLATGARLHCAAGLPLGATGHRAEELIGARTEVERR
jgi:allophanate hydrolase